MTDAATLAALHATAFDGPARWSQAAFTHALTSPACFFFPRGGDPNGFALGRVAADDAELLTLVVARAHRGHGIGRVLLDGFEAEAARRGARRVFLEVAADNVSALGLYDRAGWDVIGQRPGYYGGVDAVTMSKDLAAPPATADAASGAVPAP